MGTPELQFSSVEDTQQRSIRDANDRTLPPALNFKPGNQTAATPVIAEQPPQRTAAEKATMNAPFTPSVN